jgi:hypothetical protein
MRAAILTRISRLSTNAWSNGESHLLVDTCSVMEITLLQMRLVEGIPAEASYTSGNKLFLMIMIVK